MKKFFSHTLMYMHETIALGSERSDRFTEQFASVYQPMWQVLGEEAPAPAPATDRSPDGSSSGGGEAERPFVGDPRPLPAGWDDAWQDALTAWMGVENLEARTAAPGWIDPRVLGFLREKARG